MCVLNSFGKLELLRTYALKKEISSSLQISEALKNDPDFNRTYYRKYFGFSTPSLCVIPNKFFIRKKMSSYLDALGSFNPAEEAVYQNYNNELDINLVFSLNTQLITSILPQESFREKPLSLASGLLSGWFKRTSEYSGSQVFIHVLEGQFFVGVFDNQQLQLANHYAFETAKDFLYYVLVIYQQLEMDPNDAPVVLSGSILPASEIFNLLYRFIAHVRFIDGIADVIPLDGLEKGTEHQYFDLFSLTLCE